MYNKHTLAHVVSNFWHKDSFLVRHYLTSVSLLVHLCIAYLHPQPPERDKYRKKKNKVFQLMLLKEVLYWHVKMRCVYIHTDRRNASKKRNMCRREGTVEEDEPAVHRACSDLTEECISLPLYMQ